jgi:superfamily II DNA or RNA helicase
MGAWRDRSYHVAIVDARVLDALQFRLTPQWTSRGVNPPRLSGRQLSVSRAILVRVGGFGDLLARLDPVALRRGHQFERIVKWFLEHAPEYTGRLGDVWLWDDWPDRPSRDLGIDLVAEDHDGAVWAIQAKAYNPDYSITKADVDSFLSASASRRFSYRLLVASTDRIGGNARRTIEEQAIPVGMLLRSDLDAAELNWPASPDRLVARKAPKKTLRSDQRTAVREILAGFQSSDRGQMIRACGTGKTLAAIGVRDALRSRRTLVLVPSLSLLSQVLREWMADARHPIDAYLAVCSDETVADPDAPVASTHDLGVPVSTAEADIAAFLRRRGATVVFSTYQSSPQIAAAYRKWPRTPAFDLAICDEAHRCAGPVSSDFATILDAAAIKAKRRLFMTATPRYFTGRVIREAKDADFEIASMDDTATFGPVFHRLTFAEAIDQDLLSDYQVVIVGVDDATYKAWAERGQFVTRDGVKVTDARTLAGQIGLVKAIRRFDLRRIITFHRRVAAARNFAREMPEVVAWMPTAERPTGKLWTGYVSGEMPTGERRIRIDRLVELTARQRALLANARCLAEGVDVPTLDGVAFIDPRRSEIDIVQAVGRAIRLAPDKTIGTIVLPVFIDTDSDAAEVLSQSAFQPVWEVLKALRSHDEELASQLDALRRARGRTGTSGELPGKIVFDLPTAVGVEFTERFTTRLVDQTTATWEYWFGLLEAFTDREGHARVPAGHVEDGFRLGQWVNQQRTYFNGGRLAEDRAARLASVTGWTWDVHDDAWERGFSALQRYVELHRDALVPKTYIDDDGFALGTWVSNQRTHRRDGQLSQERIARLDAITGWAWNRIDEAWEQGYAALQRYVSANGNALVPATYTDESGFPLGSWVNVQRARYGKNELPEDRVARLAAIESWLWEPHDEAWGRGYAALQRFATEHGHIRFPGDYVDGDGFRLGQWVGVQRSRNRNGTLPADRRARLNAIDGWSWSAVHDAWERNFLALQRYVAEHRDALVPQDHIDTDGLRLGRWVREQRRRHSRGELQEDRAARLSAIDGWTWKPPRGPRRAVGA